MRSLTAITFGVMLAVTVLGLSGQAQAANVDVTHPDQYFFNDGGETTFKLTNFESAFSNAWSADTSTWTETPTIGVGDFLRGVFTITSSQNDDSSEARFSSGFELTGEFSGKVSKLIPDTINLGQANFELIPDSAFETKYGDGAMVAFFNDGTTNFSGKGTLSTSRASAVGGSLYMVLGSDGTWGTDYFWNANGSIAPGVSTFAASLDLLVNNTGLGGGTFQTLTQAPALGGAPALALIENFFALQGNTVPTSGLTNPDDYPWQLRSQDPLRAMVVPLPSAVWAGLAMLGVLGYGANRRRKRNA